jgi:hypothetical protein
MTKEPAMDLAMFGAMVLSEGHTPTTMQIVAPPSDPRATETPLWTADVKQAADEVFARYETPAPSPEVPVAQALMVVAAGTATLHHLVMDSAAKRSAEDDEEAEASNPGKRERAPSG